MSQRPVGDIVTINEGAVPYNADDLRALLEQVNPDWLRRRSATTLIGKLFPRNLVVLDNGLWLRWPRIIEDMAGFDRRDTSMPRGEPPTQFEDAITHVHKHERELGNLAAGSVITIPDHSVFVVDGSPHSNEATVYSVVEPIPGKPLITDWLGRISRADQEKLLELGKGLTDYYRGSEGSVLESDTAKPRQYSENLALYDIEPVLEENSALGLYTVSRWARQMDPSQPQRAALVNYIG